MSSGTPTQRDLEDAIRGLFAGGPVLPAAFQLRRNLADAAYEAYIFSLVLRAVEQLGGQIRLRSITSPSAAPTTFVFRGAPGAISSRRSDYGYAVCSYGGQTFEVHVDVEHEGSSGVPHEIDVSLVDATEADRCRLARRSPKAEKTRGMIECKFYSRRLDVALIRMLVGLKDDMGVTKIARLVTNVGRDRSRAVSRYCAGKRARPRATGDVTPLNPISEQQFIDSLVDDLRAWLG